MESATIIVEHQFDKKMLEEINAIRKMKLMASEKMLANISETAQQLRKLYPDAPVRSNGAMRADGWNRIPLIRMTNISLQPGTWTLDDLIADTDDGIYMITNKSWSIDDKRLNFQFGTELAYEIKNGKLGQMYKNATYTGMTPQFWAHCDAICNADHWVVWGTPNCGKGQPGQIAHTGHGAAPARFRNVQVGLMK